MNFFWRDLDYWNKCMEFTPEIVLVLTNLGKSVIQALRRR